MRIACEDVRIAPQGQLAQDMISHSLEEVLGYYETLSDGGENSKPEHRILPEDTIENRPQAPHPTRFTNRARENVNPKVAV